MASFLMPGHAGSSPLTRGKRPWKNMVTRSMRLIPAHAGKTDAAKEA